MTEPHTPVPDASAPAPRFCSQCGAPLAATARFCHNCGHALSAAAAEEDQGLDRGVDAPLVTRSRGPAAAMPWILALVAVIGGSAYVASTQPPATAAAGGPPSGMAAPFANGGGGGGGMPDIANMSPNERANRLYGRIMSFVQAGKADSAAFFAPMALAAHEMLDNPSVDERYHLGQINEMIGNAAAAAAQADTMLTADPNHLLGLMLAFHAAQMGNKPVEAKRYGERFLEQLGPQLALKKAEYEMHRAEIDRTTSEARGGK